MSDLTTWRKELASEMAQQQDEGPVLAYAPDEAPFDVEFDASYGGTRGADVLAWTVDRVYFPVMYDGAEWMGSAPRNPRPEGQSHVGGG